MGGKVDLNQREGMKVNGGGGRSQQEGRNEFSAVPQNSAKFEHISAHFRATEF